MPNICGYQMKVKGKPENVDEFVRIIQADYDFDKNGRCICDVGKHFWRVFDADVYDVKVEDGVKSVYISGSCAWSVAVCMLGGTWSYQEQCPDGLGTTLDAESERLGLAIEVFSEESGCCFMEHYVIINGDIQIDDCVEYSEYWVDEYANVDEMNKGMKTEFTQAEFEAAQNGDGYIKVGGMSWDFTI